MDRKEFFQQGFHLLLKRGAQLLEKSKLIPLINQPSQATHEKIKQRPPGASHQESEFLQKCTGCDACMKACPVNVIMIEDLEARIPLIYQEDAPCIHCPGYPCISACPSGALDRQNGTRLRVLN